MAGRYVPDLEDKNSPYYYGEDSTYKPRAPRPPKPPRSRPEFTLDANGLPVRTNAVRTGGKVYGSIPKSAKVVTQYPDGVSTGVGGGNAAQAQSLDPSAPAYIKPTPTYNGVDEDDIDRGGGGNGRSTPAPNGSGAKGTNTGYKFDLGIAEKYAGAKIADVNNFISTQLPAGPNQKSSSYRLNNDDY